MLQKNVHRAIPFETVVIASGLREVWEEVGSESLEKEAAKDTRLLYVVHAAFLPGTGQKPSPSCAFFDEGRSRKRVCLLSPSPRKSWDKESLSQKTQIRQFYGAIRVSFNEGDKKEEREEESGAGIGEKIR